jgi:hypothetical protein
MRLTFRKTVRGPLGTLFNISKRGVSSVSKRIRPLTVNSSGRVSFRLLPGFSLRTRARRRR